jgi:hypothetical protein
VHSAKDYRNSSAKCQCYGTIYFYMKTPSEEVQIQKPGVVLESEWSNWKDNKKYEKFWSKLISEIKVRKIYERSGK